MWLQVVYKAEALRIHPFLLSVNLYISNANENPCKQGLEHSIGLAVGAASFEGKLAFKKMAITVNSLHYVS